MKKVRCGGTCDGRVRCEINRARASYHSPTMHVRGADATPTLRRCADGGWAGESRKPQISSASQAHKRHACAAGGWAGEPRVQWLNGALSCDLMEGWTGAGGV